MSEYRLSKLLKEKRIQIEPAEFFRLLKKYHGGLKQLQAVARRLWAGLYEKSKPAPGALAMKDQFSSASDLLAQGMKSTDAFLAASGWSTGTSVQLSDRFLLEFFLSLAGCVQDTMFLVGIVKSMAHNCKEMFSAVASSFVTLGDTMADVVAVVETSNLCANEPHKTVLRNFAQLAKSLKQQSAQVLIKAAAGKLVSSSARLEFLAASTLLVESSAELLTVALAVPLNRNVLRLAMIASCALSQFATTLKDRISGGDTLCVENFLQRFRLVTAAFLSALVPVVTADSTTGTSTSRQRLVDAAKSVLQVAEEIIAFVQALSKLESSVVIKTGAIPLSDEDKSFAAKQTVKIRELLESAAPNVSGLPPKLPPKRSADRTTTTTTSELLPEGDGTLPMVLGDDGSIKLASLHQLVEHLTSQSQTDMLFLKTFITTYRSFTTPPIFLQKLRHRFRSAANSGEQGTVVQHRVCNVTKQWVMLQYDDFDDSLLGELYDVLDEMGRYAQYQSVTSIITNFINAKKQGENLPLPSLVDVRLEPKIPLSPSHVLFVFDEAEIARQLTLIEFSHYAAIKPVEFLDQAWSKPKTRHLAPNIMALINRSTATSMWIASCILWQQTIKDRLRLLSKLTKIAQYLLDYNNFNCLTAFMAGIDNSAVFRLKHTRESIPLEQVQFFNRIRELISPNASYSNLRTSLHTIQPPCVPFIGVYLTDLTFIEDGNPAMKDGLINFTKRRLVYRVIEEVQQYQQDVYGFEPIDNIANFFSSLPVNSDEDLYQVSLELEPRGSTKGDIA